MKTSEVCSFILITVFAFSSCRKEFPAEPFAVKNVSVSKCKTIGQNKNESSPMYITLKTTDDYYLQFDHINSWFNCEPGQITVSVNKSSDTILIDENESGSLADCICPYDVGCIIGPLEYGTYFLKFQKAGFKFAEYTLNYKKSADIKIDLDN